MQTPGALTCLHACLATQRDVPGITRAAIPILFAKGVRAISVGVNQGSSPPGACMCCSASSASSTGVAAPAACCAPRSSRHCRCNRRAVFHALHLARRGVWHAADRVLAAGRLRRLVRAAPVDPRSAGAVHIGARAGPRALHVVALGQQRCGRRTCWGRRSSPACSARAD